jgi:hypothetical protein
MAPGDASATSYTTTVGSTTYQPFNVTNVLVARQLDKPCTYETTRILDVGGGQRLSGDILVKPSGAPPQPAVVDFYIFNSSMFDVFQSRALSSRDCDVAGFLVLVQGVIKYHIDVVFPADGEYVLVFVNLSTDRVGPVSMTGTMIVPTTAIEVVEENPVMPRQISQLLILAGFLGLIAYVVFRIRSKLHEGGEADKR